MKNRIRKVRNSLKLSQEKFGARIGVSRSVINNFERGVTILSSPLLEHFCDIFNVNQDWLLTGEGEMFTPIVQTSIFDTLQHKYGLSDKTMWIIENYIALSPKEQEELYNTFHKLVSNPVS
jgi:transcriptional regulator with XRE-family HTH domain